ncbi:MAG: outer membrane protein transport protein [Moraxellaceae bacterium]|nr:outer membrane protein transport protein [Moraxellaceae bacterium]
MKLSHLTLAVASSIAMTMAHSAGLERSQQPIAPLFEEGNYAEVSYAYVSPDLKAKDALGSKADGMLEDYGFAGAAVKVAPTEDTGLALFYNKPWGVDTTYPESSKAFNNNLGATEAHVDSNALGLVASSKVGNNFTVYTGMEYQTVSGNVKGAKPAGLESALEKKDVITNKVVDGYVQAGFLPNAETFGKLMQAPVDKLTPQQKGLKDSITKKVTEEVTKIAKSPTLYELDMEDAHTFVPMVGIAYEKPEIALRAAVTYRAPAEYDIETKEKFNLGGKPISAQKSTTEIKFPQSVSVDFQTGLSEKHQLLGMVNARWVNWSDFEVKPTLSSELQNGKALADYEKDQYSVEVAVAKKFTPKLSAEIRGSYDSGTGDDLSLLGPYNAVKGIAVGAKYDVTDKMSVSGGAQYMMVDGGKVINPENKQTALKVDDSNAYALGMKLAYKF